MKKKFVWLVGSILMVLVLLAAACAPAPAKEVAPKEAAPAVKEAAPAVKEAAPAVKEAAPAVKEAAPAVKEGWVTVKLTKLDGTVMEKLVEKPRYGGTITCIQEVTRSPFKGWDETRMAPWENGGYLALSNESLCQNDWARGPAGTEERSWELSGFFGLEYISGLLAEKFEVVDPTTFTVTIRQGVRWALDPNSEASRLVGGREFTAADAVFNIRRIYMDTPTAPMYGMLGVSRPLDVYAEGKWKVVVKTPSGKLGETLEAVIGTLKMVPPEVVKKYGDANKWENVVGTGAFILVDQVSGSSATWKRNPNYWQNDPIFPENQLPYADTVKYLIMMDVSTHLAALRTGKVERDFEAYYAEEAQQLIKSHPQIQYKKGGGSHCKTWGWRQDKNLPFNDIRVRHALIMAVNMQEIVDTYYKGDAEPYPYKLSPGVPEYLKMGWAIPFKEQPADVQEIFTYNPERAKKLLAEAGYPNGFKTEVLVRAGAEYTDIALIVAEYWKKVGVQLEVVIKDAAVTNSMYDAKTYPEIVLWGRGGKPEAMYTVLTGNALNSAMCSDPKVDKYYADIAAAYFEPEKRAKLMREMNTYVLRQAFYMSTPAFYTYSFWQPWLKGSPWATGLSPYGGRGTFPYFWIDQDLKKSILGK